MLLQACKPHEAIRTLWNQSDFPATFSEKSIGIDKDRWAPLASVPQSTESTSGVVNHVYTELVLSYVFYTPDCMLVEK